MRYRSFLFAIFCNINLHQFQGEERMQVIGVVWWQTQSCWLAISNWVTLKLYNLHHEIGGLHDSQFHCFCPEFLHLDVTEINCTYFCPFFIFSFRLLSFCVPQTAQFSGITIASVYCWAVQFWHPQLSIEKTIFVGFSSVRLNERVGRNEHCIVKWAVKVTRINWFFLATSYT